MKGNNRKTVTIIFLMFVIKIAVTVGVLGPDNPFSVPDVLLNFILYLGPTIAVVLGVLATDWRWAGLVSISAASLGNMAYSGIKFVTSVGTDEIVALHMAWVTYIESINVGVALVVTLITFLFLPTGKEQNTPS